LTVVIVERATPGLRGQLTRWMLEVRAGVFVGTLSARVRAKLWKLVCARNPFGGALLIFRAANEQGFMVETAGDTSRSIFEMEGLLLVRRPLEDAPAAQARPGAAPARKVRARRQAG
jgi:CRISPR-associated protein Cas2